MAKPTKITGVTVKDIRFPTTLTADGSDAINDPDYSCAYVTILTDGDIHGNGLTFTIGRGNDIVCAAVKSYSHMVEGRTLDSIYKDFSGFYKEVTEEPQLRWLGPEKGVTHLATAAIMNALWDLWAKIEEKPLWKLLVDMTPEELVSTLDFRYLLDVITEEEAIDLLRKGRKGKEEREMKMLESGYPAYTTSVGWMGYSDDKIKRLCKEAISDGFTRFKVKVGLNQNDDIRRVGLVRHEVGADKLLMTDANQRWEVQQAIDWMKPLADYNITWIEEPTNPDDIYGHKTISEALAPLGIGVATGEHCQNRIMFKQFLETRALQYCQIDAGRLAGPCEILTIYLMAAKLGIPVCPHAGGVGLCEMVQHLSIFDYICLSNTLENRMVEYVDHLHEHFLDPVIIKKGNYMPPKMAGYSIEMKPQSVDDYCYPTGAAWEKLFTDGHFQRPNY